MTRRKPSRHEMSAGAARTRGAADGALIAYRVAGAILLLGLLWLSVTTSLAAVNRKHRPEIALRFRPDDSFAKAQIASREQLSAAAESDPDRLRALAISALEHDPTHAQAARVLGFIRANAGDVPGAFRLMSYANRLSRRDLATQLWLIEYNVQRNDVPEVLRHFDAASSTSQQATTILFPILANAIEDPELVAPIADMLKRKPWWAPSLLQLMVTQSKASGSLVALFDALADAGQAVRGDIVEALAARLAREGRSDLISRLKEAYPAACGDAAHSGC